MSDTMTPIDINEPLPFRCGPDVKCFNACCRDLNQFLTPYDILRLKNRLGLLSSHFLDRYTMIHTGPESGLPVVTLKPADTETLTCPFVTESGCSVYEDRPGSCRLYPLARAVTRNRQTGEMTEHFALIREDHCQGFDESNTTTVGEWLKTQDVEKYNEVNDLLMEIISMKNTLMPGPAEENFRQKFYMVCYDLDTFRANIQLKNIMGDHTATVPEEEMKRAMTDDEALLRLGLNWLKSNFFQKVAV